MPETINTVQFIVRMVTSNAIISYLNKERTAKDTVVRIKLATKSHRMARSSIPPAETVAELISDVTLPVNKIDVIKEKLLEHEYVKKVEIQRNNREIELTLTRTIE
jgi:hypothetical protein